jgi:hypothetical protein
MLHCTTLDAWEPAGQAGQGRPGRPGRPVDYARGMDGQLWVI